MRWEFFKQAYKIMALTPGALKAFSVKGSIV
jgi:hypothetical protein